MDNIPILYQERNKNSKALIKDAFEFKNGDRFPFIINNANYFLFGTPGDQIPENYFDNPSCMYERQIKQFENHFHMAEDNFVPYLVPWFGTGVLASGFGSEINFLDKMDPATQGFIINEIEDIDRLEMPEPFKDGLMPKVIDAINFFRSNSSIPIGITDCQGPFTTALQLAGYDKLFYWMYDYPEKIHNFMNLISESLIEWVKAQKAVSGEPLHCCVGDQGVYVPEGTGIWISDDDAVLVSSELYKEFVVPYNEKIMKAFSTGIIHYCGNANQQIDNFKSMKYLKAINVFSLGDWHSLSELKKGLGNKVAVIACDFTPMDYEDYYGNLFDECNISRSGLIIQSLFSSVIGVKNKKYEFFERNEKETISNLNNILGRYSKCRS